MNVRKIVKVCEQKCDNSGSYCFTSLEKKGSNFAIKKYTKYIAIERLK